MIEQKRSWENLQHLEIYTDGSLKHLGKLTFGGWSFVALRDIAEPYKAFGSEYGTTNQRMELTAICNALAFAQHQKKPNEGVIIYSDSAYAINCYLQDWYRTWQSNGWFNSSGKPVANQDLWDKIIPFFDNYWYHFSKVKGHGNNHWNNMCDALAQKAAQDLKDNFKGENALNG